MSDTTAHLNIPKPNRARVPPLNVDEEFDNLALAWDTVDAFLHALAQAVALKAPAEHEQAMSTIIGLVDALNEKMPKDRQFKLDDLADVNGAADAPAGYTVVKNATGMWVPSTPLAALGPHGHLISEITGLVAALAARPERSEVAAALDELGDAATKNVGTTANTVAAGDDPRFAQNIAPIGSVLMVYGNGTTPAPGYLLMNGFSVTNTYPDLRAFGLANGWPVDGNGDPICPNMGGKFPRGWLPGQVIDSGRVFGTSQADALQDHRHNLPDGAASNNAGPVYARGAGGTLQGQISDLVTGARKSTETRPYNETFTFWIKAYGAHTDQGDIDLNELVNDVNDVTVRVTALEPKAARYVSPEQAIVLSGAFTLTHGLGTEPSAVEYFLVCKTAELGYAVGQKIRWSGMEYAGGTTSIGPTSIVSSTQIIGRWGNTVPIIQHVTAGGHNGITAANWRLIVKAIP